MSKTNHIFIQARMESTRFPNKVLKKILNKTIFEHIVLRANQVKNIEKIILVTGSKEKNKDLLAEAQRLKINYYYGNEENVLDRFYQCSLKFQPENIIRITGDNPLFDPYLINEGLEIFEKTKVDILSNGRVRTFPLGLNFEIFRANSLKTVWFDTLHSFSNKQDFLKTFFPPTQKLLYDSKFKNYDFRNDKNNSHLRLTIDYEEDFILVKKIFEALSQNGNFYYNDIINFLEKNPNLLEINKKYVKKHDH